MMKLDCRKSICDYFVKNKLLQHIYISWNKKCYYCQNPKFVKTNCQLYEKNCQNVDLTLNDDCKPNKFLSEYLECDFEDFTTKFYTTEHFINSGKTSTRLPPEDRVVLVGGLVGGILGIFLLIALIILAILLCRCLRNKKLLREIDAETPYAETSADQNFDFTQNNENEILFAATTTTTKPSAQKSNKKLKNKAKSVEDVTCQPTAVVYSEVIPKEKRNTVNVEILNNNNNVVEEEEAIYEDTDNFVNYQVASSVGKDPAYLDTCPGILYSSPKYNTIPDYENHSSLGLDENVRDLIATELSGRQTQIYSNNDDDQIYQNRDQAEAKSNTLAKSQISVASLSDLNSNDLFSEDTILIENSDYNSLG